MSLGQAILNFFKNRIFPFHAHPRSSNNMDGWIELTEEQDTSESFSSIDNTENSDSSFGADTTDSGDSSVFFPESNLNDSENKQQVTPHSTNPMYPINKVDALALGKKIGEGGFGTVYLGKWNNEIAAIKVIDHENKANKIEKCENEKNVLEALKAYKRHDIVKFFEGFGADTKYYFIMEYVDNGSLHDMLKRKEPQSWEARYNIFKDITYAVAFLHSIGFVHHDLKSDNVLMTKDNHIKLCDFGAAKKPDNNVEMQGTLLWMAPEVFHGPFTTKADIFSLLMVLWEMTTFEEPYATFHLLKAYVFIQRGGREEIPKNSPKKIAHLITWGWQQEPKDRPNAEELLVELQTDIDTISPRLAAITLR